MRIVYSPLDAVRFAHAHPEEHVVFFAVGFETTAPATALAVHQAGELGLDNFSLLVSHVRVQPAMELLAGSRDNSVQGFLGAGHVCTVAGYDCYREFAERFGLPVVVTGFEPVDLLTGILECVRQLEAGEAAGSSIATAARPPRPGNVAALEIMDDVYEICDRPWRGLGVIPGGGFRLRPKWARFDAERRFGEFTVSARDESECRSGEMLDRPHQADRVPVLRQPLHAGVAARRADGLCRGSLRRVLPLRRQPQRGDRLIQGKAHADET